MGGAVSAGEDNDELIDNLVTGEYIKSSLVERVFRAVDRGNYFLEHSRENAYRDLAWKHEKIHISAPCIYSEVMESLKLGPGMSFLNLGSGTGYLSTMAGLILGPFGVNHGIELHQSNVEYATEILEEFQNVSPALDKYEFCPPSFVVGNCLLLDTSASQYDRVYCGAQCPAEHENFVKNLVRVGGILVMPINDNLLQVMRTSETTFEVRNVLPVSFASLVVPSSNDTILSSVKLPEKNPLLLQEICRSAVRVLLRKVIEMENPYLVVKRVIKRKRKNRKRHFRRIIIPFVERNRAETPEPLVRERREMEQAAQEEDAFDLDAPGPSDRNISEEQNNLQSTYSQSEQNNQIFLECGYPSNNNQEVMVVDEDNNDGVVEEEQNEEEMENPEENKEIPKSGRRRTLTANGDSGIDNISDDSFHEEYPSDGERDKNGESGSHLPGANDYCEERPPRNSNYLKRSVEDNEEYDTPELKTEERVVTRRYPHCRDSAVIFKKVAFSDPDSDELEEIDSDSDDQERTPRYDEKQYLSKYSYFMKKKINELPVPQTVKVYLNLSRPV